MDPDPYQNFMDPKHWLFDNHSVVAGQYLGPEKKARFERTQDILAKSGLLDITKKTAILIKWVAFELGIGPCLHMPVSGWGR